MTNHRTSLISEAYASMYQSEVEEGYKKMPLNKMQDQAAMKPDTPKGEMQARKIDKIRKVGEVAGKEQEEGAKLQNKLNKTNMLRKAFKKPSAPNAKQVSDARKATKMEDVAALLFDGGYALSEESALQIANHMSDEWYESIIEEFMDEGKRAHKPGGAGEGQGQRPVGVGGFHGRVGGLGRGYKGDKSKGKAAADAQHKADRKAAAKERAERRAAGEKDNPLQAG